MTLCSTKSAAEMTLELKHFEFCLSYRFVYTFLFHFYVLVLYKKQERNIEV